MENKSTQLLSNTKLNLFCPFTHYNFSQLDSLSSFPPTTI